MARLQLFAAWNFRRFAVHPSRSMVQAGRVHPSVCHFGRPRPLPQLFAGYEMPISVVCKSCKSKMVGPDKAAGRVIPCLNCGELLLIGPRTTSCVYSPPKSVSKPHRKLAEPEESLEEALAKAAAINAIRNVPQPPNSKKWHPAWLVCGGVVALFSCVALGMFFKGDTKTNSKSPPSQQTQQDTTRQAAEANDKQELVAKEQSKKETDKVAQAEAERSRSEEANKKKEKLALEQKLADLERQIKEREALAQRIDEAKAVEDKAVKVRKENLIKSDKAYEAMLTYCKIKKESANESFANKREIIALASAGFLVEVHEEYINGTLSDQRIKEKLESLLRREVDDLQTGRSQPGLMFLRLRDMKELAEIGADWIPAYNKVQGNTRLSEAWAVVEKTETWKNHYQVAEALWKRAIQR